MNPKENIKRVAAYVRCSTAQQDTALQTEAIKELADRRGWQLVLYEDKGVSGGKDSRPALDKMMAEIRAGKHQAVVVWKFDRFARSLTHLLSALNEFREHGVHFVSLTEDIDTTSPTGKLLFSLLGAIAEFEKTLIKARVQAGIDRVKAEGKKLGRPRKGFDYARAVQLRKEGKSYREITREMGVSLSTVVRSLGNG